ncbi:MAG: histone deacetylase [Myxococcales bacterium]|nr:histone deacetylase [Myxococcales bacterium]
MADPVPVYFCPEMVADAASYSPSAAKPAAVVARFLDRGLPVVVARPDPVTEGDLARAHAPSYVREVLAGRRDNGFGNRRADVARSLPFTSGAMLSAARAALACQRVTCAPCSGFHHAAWDHGAGFCTFNGLVVTAAALHAERPGVRVGILDCDMHYGDGTDEILDRLGLRGFVQHVTIGARFGAREDAAPFLSALPELVRAFRGCDVLLYQAGADPHVDDPLGGFLTTDELARRDAIVFGEARALGLPVAWNLAGGYQRDARGGIEPVLQIHENTLRACAG